MTKYRLFVFIIKLLQLPRIIFYRILSTAKVHGKYHLIQPTQFAGKGSINIGKGVTIGFFPSPFFFSSYAYIEARNHSSKISIGDDCHFNNSITLIAEHTSITIGKRVLIGTNVEVYDSDFHGVDVKDRNISRFENARPVTIGDDVFIGSNTRIIKGVSIGSGSVIANGSMVVKDIPENVIAGGVPAKVLRKINES